MMMHFVLRDPTPRKRKSRAKRKRETSDPDVNHVRLESQGPSMLKLVSYQTDLGNGHPVRARDARRPGAEGGEEDDDDEEEADLSSATGATAASGSGAESTPEEIRRLLVDQQVEHDRLVREARERAEAQKAAEAQRRAQRRAEKARAGSTAKSAQGSSTSTSLRRSRRMVKARSVEAFNFLDQGSGDGDEEEDDDDDDDDEEDGSGDMQDDSENDGSSTMPDYIVGDQPVADLRTTVIAPGVDEPVNLGVHNSEVFFEAMTRGMPAPGLYDTPPEAKPAEIIGQDTMLVTPSTDPLSRFATSTTRGSGERDADELPSDSVGLDRSGEHPLGALFSASQPQTGLWDSQLTTTPSPAAVRLHKMRRTLPPRSSDSGNINANSFISPLNPRLNAPMPAIPGTGASPLTQSAELPDLLAMAFTADDSGFGLPNGPGTESNVPVPSMSGDSPMPQARVDRTSQLSRDRSAEWKSMLAPSIQNLSSGSIAIERSTTSSGSSAGSNMSEAFTAAVAHAMSEVAPRLGHGVSTTSPGVARAISARAKDSPQSRRME